MDYIKCAILASFLIVKSQKNLENSFSFLFFFYNNNNNTSSKFKTYSMYSADVSHKQKYIQTMTYYTIFMTVGSL